MFSIIAQILACGGAPERRPQVQIELVPAAEQLRAPAYGFNLEFASYKGEVSLGPTSGECQVLTDPDLVGFYSVAAPPNLTGRFDARPVWRQTGSVLLRSQVFSPPGIEIPAIASWTYLDSDRERCNRKLVTAQRMVSNGDTTALRLYLESGADRAALPELTPGAVGRLNAFGLTEAFERSFTSPLEQFAGLGFGHALTEDGFSCNKAVCTKSRRTPNSAGLLIVELCEDKVAGVYLQTTFAPIPLFSEYAPGEADAKGVLASKDPRTDAAALAEAYETAFRAAGWTRWDTGDQEADGTTFIAEANVDSIGYPRIIAQRPAKSGKWLVSVAAKDAHSRCLSP